MRLKSFHGATLAEAMRQVRDALGRDAVIVATRDDDMGGVRVTAAIEDAPDGSRADASAASGRSDDIIEQASDALFRHNVHAGLAERLLATAADFAEEDAAQALAAAFEAHLAFRPLPESPRKPIVLTGLPGSGKTLAIAKLATAAKLKQQPVTVITTDLVRAGGVDQLAAFTNLLKIQLLEIEEPEALADIVAEMAGQSTVLIDTAGCNPFDEAERGEFARMTGRIDADIALILACGHDSEEGIDLAQAFRSLGAQRLILTRADIARRCGSMVNIAGACGLALANLSRSPQAAEALQPLDASALARMIMNFPESAATSHTTPLPQTGTYR